MNESKVCSNALKNWLLAKNFSAFLLALVISCSIVLVSPSLTAYAAETIPDFPVSENGYSHYLVYTSVDVDDFYMLYVTEDPLKCNSEKNVLVASSASGYEYYKCFTGDDSWTFEGSGSFGAGARLIFNASTVLYSSNYDVLDENGAIFFHKTPVLQMVVTQAKPEKVLGQILGLLPLLIPCLAGLVAFSKGWRFLLSILRKA